MVNSMLYTFSGNFLNRSSMQIIYKYLISIKHIYMIVCINQTFGNVYAHPHTDV